MSVEGNSAGIPVGPEGMVPSDKVTPEVVARLEDEAKQANDNIAPITGPESVTVAKQVKQQVDALEAEVRAKRAEKDLKERYQRPDATDGQVAA